LRNETLSASLTAAQAAVTNMSSSSTEVKTLRTRCDALTMELETIAGQFNEVWTILPPLSRRVDAKLASRDGSSNHGSVSPSAPLDYEALQGLYKPTKEQFAGIDELLTRVRGLVDDGKVFVERISRLQQEREMYKSNAAKAKKLVEDSRTSLQTYQQQVTVLEDRLAKSSSSESHFLYVLRLEIHGLTGAVATNRCQKVDADK
jgi:chromosome segregation ATPase